MGIDCASQEIIRIEKYDYLYSSFRVKNYKEDIDPFDRMEKVLRELYMYAVNYNVRDINSIEIFHNFRSQVETVWKDINKGDIKEHYLEELQKFVAKMRAYIGDLLFYDRSASEDAVIEYESALSCDPNNLQALKGIVAVYLKGDKINLKKALPHANRLVQIDPQYPYDVPHIKSLIEKKNRH
jgi:tetratricopeptide (TPR) repeat protein